MIEKILSKKFLAMKYIIICSLVILFNLILRVLKEQKMSK